MLKRKLSHQTRIALRGAMTRATEKYSAGGVPKTIHAPKQITLADPKRMRRDDGRRR